MFYPLNSEKSIFFIKKEIMNNCRLALIAAQKSLLYLGDLARYKEQERNLLSIIIIVFVICLVHCMNTYAAS